jgi:sensor histidine kinase YesM
MLSHDIKSAEKYLTSFSKLVRYTLDNSEVQEVTLEEELNAIRSYVELERQRFENGFEFEINCEKEIDLQDTMLLSMLLQPFVENSIKHGISTMPSGGRILIEVRKTGTSILISIEDNGIGIEQSLTWNNEIKNSHVSHGTSISFERIQAYNKVYNKNIEARIVNLKGIEGKSIGTRVEILIN